MDIKICGLSTGEALDAVVDGGASHAGFIFFEKSPRNVTPVLAATLAGRVRGRVRTVAVTVDENDAMIDAIVATMRPDMLQLHGNETPHRLAAVKERHHLPVIKAFSVREASDLEAITPYRGLADCFLFDAKPPKGSDLPGGNGVSFDWSLMHGLDPDLPYMLSGGINLTNLDEAISMVGPPGIDVSSGVETAPGKKDPALIRSLLARARKMRAIGGNRQADHLTGLEPGQDRRTGAGKA
ncbi:MAG: phosphoribosylanthranilate isomerase [Nitratireductor sp.]|nr:phosphoribosylanthranilate isomerase [Nitratireductor sp.]